MTTAASAAPSSFAGGARDTWVIAGVVLVGALATAAATVAGNGNVLLALAPILLAGALGVMWFAPLRIPVLSAIFLSLALDGKGEGHWSTPLAPLGSLLSVNLNKTIPGAGLAVPGVVVLFFGLVIIHIHRRLSGRRTDTASRALAANVSVASLGWSLAAILFLCAYGYKNGGDLQMAKAQVQTFLWVLLLAYLAMMSLRGMRDYRILGNIVLVSAVMKALLAIYIAHTAVPPYEMSNGRLATATSHGDSLLFATAVVMLLVRFAEIPVRRNAWLCGLLLPVLGLGMVANNRRLVWVQIVTGLAAYWLIGRRSRVKRAVVYGALLSLPLVIGYIAAGWSSSAKIFAPIKTLRSVADSEVDASTLYRDLENFNLIATMKINALVGTGFGHPFIEVVKLPDISFFKEYRYMPHNSVMGLWAFCGAFGFTAIFLSIGVAVFLAARSYEAARTPEERIVAFMVIGVILIYMIHCWGDIGFSERRSIFLVGPALAIAGQLAVITGAWRARGDMTVQKKRIQNHVGS